MKIRCETNPTDEHIVVGLHLGMDEFGIDNGHVEAVDRNARTVLLSRKGVDGRRVQTTFDDILDHFKAGIWYTENE